MEIIVQCCAGLDVHKDSVEACVRRMEPEGKLYHQIRHWGTATRELMAMADWFNPNYAQTRALSDARDGIPSLLLSTSSRLDVGLILVLS